MKGILDFFGLKYYDTKIKLYISKLLSGLKSVSIQIVDIVPSPVDALDNVIYFVPNDQTSDDNIFDEYVKINGQMEFIGTTACDLSNFQLNKNGLVPAPSKTGMILLSSGHWVYPGSVNGQSILNDITVPINSPSTIIGPGLKVNGSLRGLCDTIFADNNVLTYHYYTILAAEGFVGLNALMSTGFIQNTYLTIPILSNPQQFPDDIVDTYIYSLHPQASNNPLIFEFPLFAYNNGRVPIGQEALSLFSDLTHLFIHSDYNSLSFDFQLMSDIYEITIRVHLSNGVERSTIVYTPSEGQGMFTLDNSSNCEMHINRTYDIYEEGGDILIYGGLDIFIS